MKTIACYEEGCGETFQSDDRDAVLKEIYNHYMDVHPTVIPKASDEEKKAWMVTFEADWSGQ